jgi:S-adenosylmethionine synthetase
MFERLDGKASFERKSEVVESKGLGHPDVMADSIAETFSRNLSQEYLRRFGRGNLLHHNVDKLDIVGGEVKTRFGGGTVKKPIMIFFSGRATYRIKEGEMGGDGIQWLRTVAARSAREWLGEALRYVDPDNQSIIDIPRYFVATKSGSDELCETVTEHVIQVRSNDTSLGLGYYPLSPLEETVLYLRRFLNSQEFLAKNLQLGEDVKIMGIRLGTEVAITLAISFVDRALESSIDYFRRKKELQQGLVKWLRDFIEEKRFNLKLTSNNLMVNTLDDEKKALTDSANPEKHCYLTVLGTSAENGDDGAVGRGNRINGVSTYDKPVSQEACAGKNPISHVGKLYNIMAFLLARRIYMSGIAPFQEVYVKLVSRIGDPTNQPQLASFQYVAKQALTESQKRDISKTIQAELDFKLQRQAGEIPQLTEEILRGDYDNGPFLYLREQGQRTR